MNLSEYEKYEHLETFKDRIGQYASNQYRILKDRISNFENTLDDNHAVGVKLASFGSPVLMAVHEIAYKDPSLLIFLGEIDGEKTVLIQHVSQLNFLLMAIPRQPAQEKRRIGFVSDEPQQQ